MPTTEHPQPEVEPTETPATTGDPGNPEPEVDPHPEPEVDPSPEAPEEPPDDTDDGAPDTAKLRAEAAKYRRRAQDAEAERDALRTELDGLRRSEVERRLEGRLARPEDVWLVHEVADFMGDDGLDADKLTGAIDALLEERPNWGPPHPGAAMTRRPQPIEGGEAEPSVSWREALTNRNL